MPIASVGPARIHYEIEGQGAHALVLLHELGGTLETWAEVAPALGQRFRTLRLDYRGAGHSPPGPGDPSIDTHAGDVAALLDALKIDAPCHIAGCAIGSAVAIRFAVRYPSRVGSLVLVAPVMGVAPERRVYLHERAAAVEREGMSAAVDASLANSYPPEIIRDRARYENYRASFLAQNPHGYAALNRGFAPFEAKDDLAKIACPVLVVGGLHDKLRRPPEVELVAKSIPGARKVMVDAGHVIPVQAPDELIRAMAAFYDSLERA